MDHHGEIKKTDNILHYHVLSLFVAEEKDRHYKLNDKRKRIKRQITVHKILHRKQKIEQQTAD
jgi:hypothetical protein